MTLREKSSIDPAEGDDTPSIMATYHTRCGFGTYEGHQANSHQCKCNTHICDELPRNDTLFVGDGIQHISGMDRAGIQSHTDQGYQSKPYSFLAESHRCVEESDMIPGTPAVEFQASPSIAPIIGNDSETNMTTHSAVTEFRADQSGHPESQVCMNGSQMFDELPRKSALNHEQIRMLSGTAALELRPTVPQKPVTSRYGACTTQTGKKATSDSSGQNESPPDILCQTQDCQSCTAQAKVLPANCCNEMVKSSCSSRVPLQDEEHTWRRPSASPSQLTDLGGISEAKKRCHRTSMSVAAAASNMDTPPSIDRVGSCEETQGVVCEVPIDAKTLDMQMSSPKELTNSHKSERIVANPFSSQWEDRARRSTSNAAEGAAEVTLERGHISSNLPENESNGWLRWPRVPNTSSVPISPLHSTVPLPVCPVSAAPSVLVTPSAAIAMPSDTVQTRNSGLMAAPMSISNSIPDVSSATDNVNACETQTVPDDQSECSLAMSFTEMKEFDSDTEVEDVHF